MQLYFDQDCQIGQFCFPYSKKYASLKIVKVNFHGAHGLDDNEGLEVHCIKGLCRILGLFW